VTPDIDEMKRQFAGQLKKCLEVHYGGRIPSLSTIARDFSLKANHLPHVSGETVRKWLRAETIPQYPRVQSLADWLGPELLLPFKNWQLNNRINISTNSSEIKTITPEEATELMEIVQNLARDEFNLIMMIAQKLQLSRTFEGRNLLQNGSK